MHMMEGVSERTGQLLGVVALAATDRMRAEVERELDAGGGAAAALVHVEAWPGGSVNDLAGVVGLSQPAAVRLVDRLVARGLLARGAGPDGRTRALRCTEAGQTAARDILERRRVALESLLDGFDARKRATLERYLEQIVRTLADDRPTALRVCRLCDRTRCYAHGIAVCPLEHTTELPDDRPDRPIRYETQLQALRRSEREDEARIRKRAAKWRTSEAGQAGEDYGAGEPHREDARARREDARARRKDPRARPEDP